MTGRANVGPRIDLGSTMEIDTGFVSTARCGGRRMVGPCWVHKTAKVLNKLPKTQQAKSKRAQQEILPRPTRMRSSPPTGFVEIRASRTAFIGSRLHRR
jgi:hypothetical protein